jgi:peptidoglycan/xylan/chitin deacetylase (PgdA/CDA1 family)
VTPEGFACQLDYIQQKYDVVTCEHLSAFLRGETDLPAHPLLITFDDGYRDNFSNAYPILAERKFPALIFLASDYMQGETPFFWDYVAYCFQHTHLRSAELPVLGFVSWSDQREKKLIVSRWVNLIKRLPDQEKKSAVSELASILEVEIVPGAFSELYVTWDQVREMNQNGIEFGAHTAGHPILTSIPLSQVEDELVRSKRKIEAEIEKPIISFAYPNGGVDDFSLDVVALVKKAGFELAFTLIRGTTPFEKLRTDPLTIRRINLSASDNFSRFVTKLSVNRFIH